MHLKKILKPIQKDLDIVENLIYKNLENKIGLIKEVGKHIFGSGGKRLRPTLTILSCRYYNIDDPVIYELATAIEYIHTATLLHDDVVDNSELRRGQETANILWGNQAPVLVGDYLFAKAFILMVKSNNLKILKLLSDVTGLLAQGEIYELVKTGDLYTKEEEYFEIIEEKTGVLISAASQIGPLMADAPLEEIEIFKDYGKNIGIAFQLVDDALDYISTDKELGKKIGIDIREGKVTLPLIAALKGNSNELIKEIFYKDELSDEDINIIRKFVIENNGIEATLKSAEKYVNNAKKAILKLKPSNETKILDELASFIIKRRY